jgi:hypothetical protein
MHTNNTLVFFIPDYLLNSDQLLAFSFKSQYMHMTTLRKNPNQNRHNHNQCMLRGYYFKVTDGLR